MTTALDLFIAVRKLLKNPEHWDKWAPASYWEASAYGAGWRACTTGDPAAKRFTLFGAIYRTVPGADEAAKAKNYKRFVQIMEAGMKQNGLVLRRDASYAVWSGVNAVDNWANTPERTHAEVMSMLSGVIQILAEAEA